MDADESPRYGLWDSVVIAPSGFAIVRAAPVAPESSSALLPDDEQPASAPTLSAAIAPMAIRDLLSFIASP
ncbi:hypothetical protein MZK47_13675 [Microbacterium aerolatum]|uniref:hypothetical protein n=1 Tax=Microbacterium aerolatum TaxID=153731 RepID=UPI0020007DCD|nr:hypothetical protein [Microbacterium aerolatum]MCK3770724.1 hypothetical protein [Microbacterium aerolatum]